MRPRLSSFCAALLALALGACSTPQTHYYSLAEGSSPSQPAPTGQGVPGAAAPSTPLFIELAPLAIPERLARPQLLVRQASAADAEVAVLEQHRWASSLESELRDALGSNIARRLGAVDATQGGRQSGQAAWRIAVQVRQWDAVEDSHMAVALSWTLRRTDADLSLACQWAGTEAVGSGIGALAQAARQLTSAAADAIARHVASAAAAAPGAAACVS